MLIYTLCSTSIQTLIVLQESGYWWNTVQFCKIRPQHKIFLARPCPSFRADYQSRKTKLTFKKNYICDHFLCSLSCLTYCPFFLFIILSLGQNIVSCCFKVHYKKISLKGCQSSRFTQTWRRARRQELLFFGKADKLKYFPIWRKNSIVNFVTCFIDIL